MASPDVVSRPTPELGRNLLQRPNAGCGYQLDGSRISIGRFFAFNWPEVSRCYWRAPAQDLPAGAVGVRGPTKAINLWLKAAPECSATRLNQPRHGKVVHDSVSVITMKAIEGYRLILPSELTWRPSSLMRIPNADYLERTGSELLGARLWRMPPKSANTLHKHVLAEEFYFVLEGTGRIRVGDATLTIPHYGGVLVGPSVLRQIFNDSDSEGV
jgi:mannose-6-phosphate isomerase-like protein (cupin superfamily)